MKAEAQIPDALRLDGEIAREIARVLKADLDVPDHRVIVKVTNGVVTLEGIVANLAQKEATERCTRQVEGVREIANQILVEAPAAQS